jgi:hypothetical protein
MADSGSHFFLLLDLPFEEPMSAASPRRLYVATELPTLLQLSQEQIDRLVGTGQLRSIRICGEIRFDSHELDALIETYKQIERRNNPHVAVIQ